MLTVLWCQEGYGQFWWTEGPSRGDKYIGYFRADEREGEGSYYFSNGDVFTGGWRAGLQHGPGYQTFPNGNILDGSWLDGQRDGVFIFVFPGVCLWQTTLTRDPALVTLKSKALLLFAGFFLVDARHLVSRENRSSPFQLESEELKGVQDPRLSVDCSHYSHGHDSRPNHHVVTEQKEGLVI